MKRKELSFVGLQKSSQGAEKKGDSSSRSANPERLEGRRRTALQGYAHPGIFGKSAQPLEGKRVVKRSLGKE
jgi:hypothetical protein